MAFTHQKLDAYQSAIRFVSGVQRLLARIPRTRHELCDQLHRASLSVPLNIAEGSGEFSAAEKRRFYRMALRSGNECAAILELMQLLELAEETTVTALLSELSRTVAMLTRLAIK